MHSNHQFVQARRRASGFFTLPPFRTAARLLLLAAGALAVAPAPLFLSACEKKAPAAEPGPTHTVRGRVMKLPIAGDPSSSFSLFHEEIADWLRPDGTRGMGAMVMPFPLASGVSVDDLRVGDIVELSVRQYKTGPLPYETLSVRKLPADTVLTLPDRGS